MSYQNKFDVLNENSFSVSAGRSSKSYRYSNAPLNYLLHILIKHSKMRGMISIHYGFK